MNEYDLKNVEFKKPSSLTISTELTVWRIPLNKFVLPLKIRKNQNTKTENTTITQHCLVRGKQTVLVRACV